MVQHRWNHTTGAACRRGDNTPAGGILLAYGKGIGIHQSPALQALVISLGMHVVAHGLAADTKASGKYSLGLDATFHSLFHHLPYLCKIVPDLGALAAVHILPVGSSTTLAFRLDVLDVSKRIDVGTCIAAHALFHDIAASDGIHRPGVDFGAFGIESTESHGVGVEGKHRFRLPDYFCGSHGGEHLQNGLVGEVASAGGGQGTVECHAISRHMPASARRETLCGLAGAHGVRRRRSVAYLI